MKSAAGPDERHVLQCMDLWSGNRSVENEAQAPGLDIFVWSEPYRGESTGGDLHYVSLCAGGIITRLILADVAGHGTAVAETSQMLRSLMRRFMNAKRQEHLVRDLNREFSQLAKSGRFATAIVATYLSHRQRFTICNAGHPRPLWYRRESDSWSYVNEELVETGRASNLPLGLDESTEYQQFELHVGEGDMLVFYTDALTEAHGVDGGLLGEEGLLRIVAELDTDHVREFGRRALQAVQTYSGGQAAQDDVTLLALKFSTVRRRTPGVREKLTAYAKLLGLKPV
ncbi:MAG TPA: PP2C family protein-serine/threonine phosphatase [Planctomycetaceae bacterium]